MPTIICRRRGVTEIEDGIQYLDESKAQLLFTKFPVGSGTFKRTKYLHVKYIGPKCGIVKRGQGMGEINAFTDREMKGIAGFSTTDKASLSFETLVAQMRDVFVTDFGSFSLDQIKADYKKRLLEEHKAEKKEETAKKAQANARIERRRASIARLRRNSKVGHRRSTTRDVSETAKELAECSQEKMDRITKMLLDSLREPDGPVNWIIFEAEPTNPRVTAYGRNGIFEMVNNLPDDKWLFGLFRISFNTGKARERRIILFQFIGSQLKAVKGSGVYPGMAKLLSPFDYEIYLIGHSDLDVQAIINKSKNAFHEVQKQKGDITFTAAQYKLSLADEQTVTNSVAFDPFQKPKSRSNSGVLPDLSSTIGTEGVPMPEDEDQLYDVQETLSLIKMPEGGLVWGIFEVQF